MKKLMLLPLLVMSMLVGCNEKQEEETIYTPDVWLKDNDVFENDLRYYVGGYTGRDYDYKISAEMMDSFKIEFKYPKKTNKINQNDLFTYMIKKNVGPYTQCNFYFHETTVETWATGYVDGKKVEQLLEYNCYGSYGVTRLMLFTINRYKEVNEIQKAEHETATAFNTLENFYKQIEESTVNPTATFSNLSREDVNHALLDDIKDLEIGSEKAYSGYGGGAFMSYGINEDFMLRFYLDYEQNPFASLEYKYQSSLNYITSVKYSYKVSREKVDILIKKITGVLN